MVGAVQGILSVLGRLLLCAIFLVSAVAQDILHYQDTVGMMERKGIPQAPFVLLGAIVFLLLGSAMVIAGRWARFGALLLLIFLGLATYYFHNFWDVTDANERQNQMAHFMKNVALAGAMLLIMGSGPGRGSIDERRRTTSTA
jgi:putative oxidoreductase